MLQHNGILYLLLTILSGASMTPAFGFFRKTDGNRYGILAENCIAYILLAVLLENKPSVVCHACMGRDLNAWGMGCEEFKRALSDRIKSSLRRQGVFAVPGRSVLSSIRLL